MFFWIKRHQIRVYWQNTFVESLNYCFFVIRKRSRNEMQSTTKEQFLSFLFKIIENKFFSLKKCHLNMKSKILFEISNDDFVFLSKITMWHEARRLTHQLMSNLKRKRKTKEWKNKELKFVEKKTSSFSIIDNLKIDKQNFEKRSIYHNIVTTY